MTLCDTLYCIILCTHTPLFMADTHMRREDCAPRPVLRRVAYGTLGTAVWGDFDHHHGQVHANFKSIIRLDDYPIVHKLSRTHCLWKFWNPWRVHICAILTIIFLMQSLAISSSKSPIILSYHHLIFKNLIVLSTPSWFLIWCAVANFRETCRLRALDIQDRPLC